MKMTKRERLIAAMRLEEPDYVPVSPRIMLDDIYGCNCWMHHLLAGREFDYDPHIILGPQGPRARYLWYPFGPFDLKDVKVKLNVETFPRETIVSRKFETPVGVLTDKTRLPRRGSWNPKVRAYYSPNPYKTEYLVKGPEDLDKLRYLISRLYEAYPPSNRLPDYHEVKKYVGEEGVVEYAVYGVIDHVMVYGSESMMIDYYRDKKFLKELLKILWEPVVIETEAALEAGVDVIFASWYVSSLSTGWSPKMYKELFAPLIKEQAD